MVAVALLTIAAFLLSPSVPAESTTSHAANPGSLTQAQGEAILQELRSIRRLLEKQQNKRKPGKRRPASAKVEFSEAVILGDANAPVTMLEFTDYQCPYCKRFHQQTLPKLKEKYIDTGKLRFISLDMPLSFHPQAMPAAQAARCANEQGRFWEMREQLFSNPRALAKPDLLTYAENLSLQKPEFEACLDSERYAPKIKKDMQTARKAGFTGTPSFVLGKTADGFVQGPALVGAKPVAEFERAIQALLNDGSDS